VSAFVGGMVSRLSGRVPWRGALRQLLIVAICAAVTFSIGRLFGTTVA
jgi:VIT1/CCC1 family predicted Fe2+/Mn2+ transporter